MIDVVGLVIAALGLLVSAVGLGAIFVQLRSGGRVARSALYAELSPAMQQLTDLFLERPSFRAYFYDDKDLVAAADSAEAESDRVIVDSICEAIVDFADDVVEQYRALPDGMDWSTWWSLFRFLYAHSPALRSHLWENHKAFYPDYILQAFGFIVVRDWTDGLIRSYWIVREAELGPRGYPWITTWRFSNVKPEGSTELQGHLFAAPTRDTELQAEVRAHEVRVRSQWRIAKWWTWQWPFIRRRIVATVVEEFISSDLSAGESSAASRERLGATDRSEADVSNDVATIRAWILGTLAGTNVDFVEFASPVYAPVHARVRRIDTSFAFPIAKLKALRPRAPGRSSMGRRA